MRYIIATAYCRSNTRQRQRAVMLCSMFNAITTVRSVNSSSITIQNRVALRCSPSPNRANGGRLIGNLPLIAFAPSKARADACCDA